MQKKKHYKEVGSMVNFANMEENILSYWEKNDIFNKSVDNRIASKKEDEFIFYDGPPFANGLPHYGHLLTGFIKDAFARYQTLKGKKVQRRFGWDCHGLPAEMAAEKELGISGRAAIEKFGVDKFNNHCETSVMKFSGEWEKYVKRQARWVDFENSYKTMDKNFMESVFWAFKELHKKGLIYESMRVMPYSWACETPLSNFETKLDNSYRERADKAVTVSFKLKNKPDSLDIQAKNYYALAWTTTPWTLPSNLALAVAPDMDYACVNREGNCYIIAKFALQAYKKELKISDEEEFETIKGRDLANLEYQPLFDYFENHQNAFKIFVADFVIEGDGTGIVHMAPGFGEDDQIICAKEGIKLVCPVDNAGCFTSEISDFVGMQVFDANDPIIIKLKEKGNWIKTEQYLHNYPHCWRTDTPLIYKAVPSWYVEVTKFKDRMVELNQEINWIPGHIKDGLFGKWLENARDWSISRNRFWGTPIPIWKSDDPKYPRMDVYGSIKELENDFGVKIDDLHKPFIDDLTRANPDDPTGKSTMRRVSDVFDCWFESGSMPYGQAHYPFENKEWFESHFPADFIVEYTAQTRGWFYTLMVLSTALFDRPPFLNCICHGVILDSTGQKLSKRLNNYADPLEIFDEYGSDALRATMLASTVTKGQELLIDKDGKMVYDSSRLILKPIWNAYHFFTLYANSDGIKAEESFESNNVLDRYILTKLKAAIANIETHMDAYDSASSYQEILDFFEVLNNWYIRRSRMRFWKSISDDDKIHAYNTLYTSLVNISVAMSPLLPLLAEEIYLGLTGKDSDNSSVHLQNYPNLSHYKEDLKLSSTMDNVLDICKNALFIRSSENIRVRQPLASLKIIHQESDKFSDFAELIKDEINVKQVIFENNLSEFADEKLSIFFPILGKRIPKKMKDIIVASKKGEWEIISGKLIISGEELLENEYQIILQAKSSNGSKALSDNQGLILLDLEITEELEKEGVARDIIRHVQEARKNAELEVSDKIELELISEANIGNVIKDFGDLIMSQTLSSIKSNLNAEYTANVELLGKKLEIKLKKIEALNA